jgi:hypothetical protein
MSPFAIRCIAWSIATTSIVTLVHFCCSFAANDIFMAMWNEAKQTSIMDCMPIFYSLVKVGGGLVVFGSGNPLIWGGAWYANKRYKAMMEEWTNQERLAELEKKKKLKLK